MNNKTEKFISRKIFHLSSLWMPLLYFYSDEITMLLLVGFVLIAVGVMDVLRITNTPAKAYVNKILKFFGFAQMLKPEEARGMSGAFYLALGVFLSVLFFHNNLAIVAITIAIVSDPIASIIGKKCGKHKVLDKSWEGFFTFVIISSCIVLLSEPYLHLRAVPAMVAVLAAAGIELVSKKLHVDDNLSIPLGFCIIYNLLS